MILFQSIRLECEIVQNKKVGEEMDTHQSVQIKNLRDYIQAIETQLRSYQTQRTTLMNELTNYETINQNMRLQIDYLVTQLKQLDTIIDEKNKQSQTVRKDSDQLREEIKTMNNMLLMKDKRIEELVSFMAEKQKLQQLYTQKDRNQLNKYNPENKTEGVSKLQQQSMPNPNQIQQQTNLKLKKTHRQNQQFQVEIRNLLNQIQEMKFQLNQKDIVVGNLEKQLGKKTALILQKDQQLIKIKRQQRQKEQVRQGKIGKLRLSKVGSVSERIEVWSQKDNNEGLSARSLTEMQLQIVQLNSRLIKSKQAICKMQVKLRESRELAGQKQLEIQNIRESMLAQKEMLRNELKAEAIKRQEQCELKIDQLQISLKKLEQERDECEQRILKCQSILKEKEQELGEKQLRITEYKSEIHFINEQLQQASFNYATKQGECNKLVKKIESLDLQIERLNCLIERKDSEMQLKQKEIVQIEDRHNKQLAQLKQQCTLMQNQKQQLKVTLKHLQSVHQSLKHSHQLLKAMLQSTTSSLKQSRQQAETLKQQKNQLDQQHKQAIIKQEQINQTNLKLQRELVLAQSKILQKEQQIFSQKQQIVNLSTHIEEHQLNVNKVILQNQKAITQVKTQNQQLLKQNQQQKQQSVQLNKRLQQLLQQITQKQELIKDQHKQLSTVEEMLQSEKFFLQQKMQHRHKRQVQKLKSDYEQRIDQINSQLEEKLSKILILQNRLTQKDHMILNKQHQKQKEKQLLKDKLEKVIKSEIEKEYKVKVQMQIRVKLQKEMKQQCQRIFRRSQLKKQVNINRELVSNKQSQLVCIIGDKEKQQSKGNINEGLGQSLGELLLVIRQNMRRQISEQIQQKQIKQWRQKQSQLIQVEFRQRISQQVRTKIQQQLKHKLQLQIQSQYQVQKQVQIQNIKAEINKIYKHQYESKLSDKQLKLSQRQKQLQKQMNDKLVQLQRDYVEKHYMIREQLLAEGRLSQNNIEEIEKEWVDRVKEVEAKLQMKQQQIVSLHGLVSEIKQRVNVINKEKHILQTTIQALKQSLNQKQQIIQQTQKIVDQKVKIIEEKHSIIRQKEQQLDHNLKMIETKQQELKQYQQQVQELRHRIKHNEENLKQGRKLDNQNHQYSTNQMAGGISSQIGGDKVIRQQLIQQEEHIVMNNNQLMASFTNLKQKNNLIIQQLTLQLQTKNCQLNEIKNKLSLVQQLERQQQQQLQHQHLQSQPIQTVEINKLKAELQLKEKQIQQILHSLQEKEQQIREKNQVIEQKDKLIKEKQQLIIEREDVILQKQERILENIQHLNAYRDEVTLMEDQFKHLQYQLKEKTAKLKSLQDQLYQLTHNSNGVNSNKDGYVEQKGSRQLAIQQQQQSQRTSQEQQDKIHIQQINKQYQQRINDLKQEKQHLLMQKQVLKSQMNRLQSENTTYKEQISALSKKLRQEYSLKKQLQQTVKNMEIQLQCKVNQLLEKEQIIKFKDLQIHQNQSLNQQLTNKINEIKQVNQHLQIKLKELNKSNTKTNQSYDAGVSKVDRNLNDQDNNKDILQNSKDSRINQLQQQLQSSNKILTEYQLTLFKQTSLLEQLKNELALKQLQIDQLNQSLQTGVNVNSNLSPKFKHNSQQSHSSESFQKTPKHSPKEQNPQEIKVQSSHPQGQKMKESNGSFTKRLLKKQNLSNLVPTNEQIHSQRSQHTSQSYQLIPQKQTKTQPTTLLSKDNQKNPQTQQQKPQKRVRKGTIITQNQPKPTTEQPPLSLIRNQINYQENVESVASSRFDTKIISESDKQENKLPSFNNFKERQDDSKFKLNVKAHLSEIDTQQEFLDLRAEMTESMTSQKYFTPYPPKNTLNNHQKSTSKPIDIGEFIQNRNKDKNKINGGKPRSQKAFKHIPVITKEGKIDNSQNQNNKKIEKQDKYDKNVPQKINKNTVDDMVHNSSFLQKDQRVVNRSKGIKKNVNMSQIVFSKQEKYQKQDNDRSMRLIKSDSRQDLQHIYNSHQNKRPLITNNRLYEQQRDTRIKQIMDLSVDEQLVRSPVINRGRIVRDLKSNQRQQIFKTNLLS